MSITFLEKHQEADILRGQFHALAFIQSMEKGELNQNFIDSFLDCLYVENFLFVLEMAKMRINFCKHPEFITDFLDPHTMTEFGAELNSVGLKAQGATHY